MMKHKDTHAKSRPVDVPSAEAESQVVGSPEPADMVVGDDGTGGQPPTPGPDGRGGFVSAERLYLTRDGRVVKGDDPDKHELLVAENGRIPLARAQELGLAEKEDAKE